MHPQHLDLPFPALVDDLRVVLRKMMEQFQFCGGRGVSGLAVEFMAAEREDVKETGERKEGCELGILGGADEKVEGPELVV
jgi:hypothetical protein